MNDFVHTTERQFKEPGEWQYSGPLDKAIECYRARFGCDPISHTARGGILCFPLPTPTQETEQLLLFGGMP